MTPTTFIPRAEFLPFSPPDLTEEEIEAVVDTLRSGWVTTGPKTREFAEEFKHYVGSEAALPVNSCTGGLHIALAALGVGPGDEVITTAMTFCASVNVIEHVGATPVLVDVEPDTLNMDPVKVAAAITERTKVIMPVHFAGHPVDMDPIMELAKKHNLYVVEDAAHALPTKYKDQMVGAIGDMTAFSFYATKNLTTGEGGMLTGKEELVDRARLFSLHGMSRDAWKRYSAEGSWFYEVVEAGFKYNMTDMQAAMGQVQLKRLEQMQQNRYHVVERYNDAFRDMPELEIPAHREGMGHAWHLYVLRFNLDTLTIDRSEFIKQMGANNIGTSVHFIPIHLHPYYRNKYEFDPEDFPVAYSNYQRTMSLPLHPGLTEEDIDDVIATVKHIVAAHRV